MIDQIDAEGLADFASFFRGAPEKTTQAARLAINQIADRIAVPLSREEIQRQVNFPLGYLDDDRLGVSKRATGASLEAIVRGRNRPTSLARFAPGASLGSTSVISLTVKPGKTTTMRRAFLVKLPQGTASTEDKFNIGLAVRLKAGETLRNKNQAGAMLAPNVYLLYGPSVGQVFRDVADKITPEILDDLEEEFLRQFVRVTEQ